MRHFKILELQYWGHPEDYSRDTTNTDRVEDDIFSFYDTGGITLPKASDTQTYKVLQQLSPLHPDQQLHGKQRYSSLFSQH